MNITGTSHFKDRDTAIRYYSDYEVDPVSAVNLKLAEGEISLGEPALKAGQKLILLDDGTRYGVVEE